MHFVQAQMHSSTDAALYGNHDDDDEWLKSSYHSIKGGKGYQMHDGEAQAHEWEEKKDDVGTGSPIVSMNVTS